MKEKFRLAVLASGGGTNLQSLIDQSQSGRLDAEIVLVICNNPNAGALVRAENAGIRNICINHRDFTERQSFDQKVVDVLKEAQPDLIVLAGFMRIISSVFLKAFPQRIINIHPLCYQLFPACMYKEKPLSTGLVFQAAPSILLTMVLIQVRSYSRRWSLSTLTTRRNLCQHGFLNRSIESTPSNSVVCRETYSNH